MPPLVSLRRQPDYDSDGLRAALAGLLAPLGGMEAFCRRGDRVILKPNLVMGRPPEDAVTTHPAVVEVVAEMALDCGARVALGDSPGLGPGRKAGRTAGLVAVADRLELDWIEFTPREHRDASRRFRTLTLAGELLDADLVVNLPKLKTHGQMLMTMAVKNLFGAVVGPRKFEWHWRAGEDKTAFARMLYEICATVAPGLTLMDAVVAMDGNGPTSGTPNPTGFLAAGTDPSAVDAVLLDILGIPRDDLPTLAAARAAGDTAWESVEVAGDSVRSCAPARWTLPETADLAMGATFLVRRFPAIRRWLRRQIAALPRPSPERCVRCGVCVDICPARAFSRQDGEIRLDRSKCIRCYCCHELCPHDAMDLRRGWLGRLAEALRPASRT